MAKMGRPPLNEKAKNKLLSVRFSESELKELQEYANQHNLTLTQLVKVALNRYMRG